ncbi:unnamed protein product, partial [Musa acuminata subsp. burmannicoides]
TDRIEFLGRCAPFLQLDLVLVNRGDIFWARGNRTFRYFLIDVLFLIDRWNRVLGTMHRFLNQKGRELLGTGNPDLLLSQLAWNGVDLSPSRSLAVCAFLLCDARECF